MKTTCLALAAGSIMGFVTSGSMAGGHPACPGTGDCFEAHPGPGCENAECCNQALGDFIQQSYGIDCFTHNGGAYRCAP